MLLAPMPIQIRPSRSVSGATRHGVLYGPCPRRREVPRGRGWGAFYSMAALGVPKLEQTGSAAVVRQDGTVQAVVGPFNWKLAPI